jgi:hypothetical protein
MENGKTGADPKREMRWWEEDTRVEDERKSTNTRLRLASVSFL